VEQHLIHGLALQVLLVRLEQQEPLVLEPLQEIRERQELMVHQDQLEQPVLQEQALAVVVLHLIHGLALQVRLEQLVLPVPLVRAQELVAPGEQALMV